MSYKEFRSYLRDFNAIYKETDAIYSDFAKRSGLSDCAFWLLYTIYEADEKFTQKDISSQWILSKQTVNSALKSLEKNGYITLTSSETNKRSKYITLSDKGMAFAHENISIIFEMEQLALQKMSEAERVAMLEINRKYQELLREEANHFLKK